MRAVSNTSPLSNLAIIGRLELLERQFQRIVIPDAVEDELRLLPNKTARESLDRAKTAGWIEVAHPNNHALIESLRSCLHLGEAAAIALATETKPDLLLIDEREGRQAAHRLGIEVKGVLGILLRAKFAGDLPAIRPEIESLETKAGFRIAPALRQKILQAAEE
jgi:hypothetical protein